MCNTGKPTSLRNMHGAINKHIKYFRGSATDTDLDRSPKVGFKHHLPMNVINEALANSMDEQLMTSKR